MRRWLVAAMIVSTTGVAAGSPDDVISRPLVLRSDTVGADLTAEINLASEQVGKPLSIAPDLWWGVSTRWTVGVIHSNRSLDQIEPGASVCLHVRDLAGLCDRAYHGSGADARWSAFDDGTFAIAPRARFLIRDVDPWKPAATIGALVRWHHGRFAITGDPYVLLGLGNNGLGNRDRLVVPLYFALQPLRRVELAFQTGYQSDFAVIRDGWHIPAALRLTLRPTQAFDVVVEGGLPSALGPQNDVKQRSMFVTLAWRSAD